MTDHARQFPVATHDSATLQLVSEIFIRSALVLVFAWFGFLKFSAYEANAIAGLAINSPVFAWLHALLGVQGFSNFIGTVELAAAVLLAAHPVSAKLGVLGGLLASATFAVTLSFMVTTPGVMEVNEGGFPYLSVMPGEFLLKDVVLLAVSIWLLVKSLHAINQGSK